MPTRDAVSTIKGYYYQFDYSILKVLKLEHDTDTICIEGIEDVDISDGSNIGLHQCKCYEGTEYSHSKIKDALWWMLIHFSENRDSHYKYYIYGVYSSGQEKLPEHIDVEFAKKHFFTKTHRGAPAECLYYELNLADQDIELFLKKLTININAASYKSQEQEVRNELCRALGRSEQEVEPYYCNALSIIRSLSTNPNSTKRTISRSQFISRIRETDNHFEIWLLNKFGDERFAKFIKKEYFTCNTNISPFDRFFIIECNQYTSMIDLKTAVLTVAKKFSKLSKRAFPRYCPYFCFYGIKDDQLIELKKSMARDNYILCDGYDFKGADFNAESLVREPLKELCDKDRLWLRFIDSIDLLDKVLDKCKSTVEIYQFYSDNVFYGNNDYYHVQIPCKNVSLISKMVK